MANLTLRAVFQAVDRISAPVRGISQAIGNGLGRALRGVSSAASTMGQRVRQARQNLDQLRNSSDRTNRSTSGLARGLGMLGGVFAGLSVVGLVKGIVQVGMQFEQFEAKLTTILGDQGKAKAAMGWVTDFAKTTPYEVAEVTEAFIDLNKYGIEATDGTLRTLGDTASGMGVPMKQAVEAMGDAVTFEFERLKEFGILTSQQGDKVTFSYMKAGKQQTATVKKSSGEIKKAITGIFDSKFAGAMDKQSQTLGGILSNLADFRTSFALKINNGGLFDSVKGRLSGLLSQLNLLEKNGQLDAWAKKLSDALATLFDSLVELISSIDWPAFIAGLAGAITGFTDFVKAIGGFKTVLDLGIAAFIASTILGLTGMVPAILAVGAAFGITTLAAGPIILVIAAVAALAAGAFLLWRNWDSVKKFFAGLFDWLKTIPAMISKSWNSLLGFFGGLFKKLTSFWKGLPWWMQALINLPLTIVTHWGQIAPAIAKAWNTLSTVFKNGVNAVWNAMPEWMQGILKGVFTVVDGQPAKPAAAPARPSPNVGGKFQHQIDVKLRGAPAAVTRMKSSSDAVNLSVTSDVGRQ